MALDNAHARQPRGGVHLHLDFHTHAKLLTLLLEFQFNKRFFFFFSFVDCILVKWYWNSEDISFSLDNFSKFSKQTDLVTVWNSGYEIRVYVG